MLVATQVVNAEVTVIDVVGVSTVEVLVTVFHEHVVLVVCEVQGKTVVVGVRCVVDVVVEAVMDRTL